IARTNQAGLTGWLGQSFYPENLVHPVKRRLIPVLLAVLALPDLLVSRPANPGTIVRARLPSRRGLGHHHWRPHGRQPPCRRSIVRSTPTSATTPADRG